MFKSIISLLATFPATPRGSHLSFVYGVTDEVTCSVCVVLHAWTLDEERKKYGFHRDYLDFEGAHDPKSTHATQNKISMGNGRFLFT